MADRTSTITLRVVDQFSGTLQKFQTQMAQVVGTGGRAGVLYDQYGNAMRTAGVAAGQAATAQTQAAAATAKVAVAATGATTATTQHTAAAMANTGRTADATRASMALNSQLVQLGRGMMSTFTGFIAGVAAAALLKQALGGIISAGINFDKAMRQVNAVAQLSESQLANLAHQVRSFASETRTFTGTATDAARALTIVVQAGIPVEQGMALLKAASVGAMAGFTDLGSVAQALVGIMNAYGESSDRASHNVNVLAQMVSLGVITWQELVQHMGTAIGSAAAARQPIEIVGAAIAIMTQRTIGASEAFVSLNRIFLSLINPSQQAKELAKELGLEWNFAALQSKGLVQMLLDMNIATGGNLEQMAILLGETRAIRGALALIEGGGADFVKMLKGMQDAQKGTGAAMSQAEQSMKSAQYTLDKFKQAWSNFATELGLRVLPPLTSLFDALTKLAKSWVVKLIVELPDFLMGKTFQEWAREGGQIGGLPIFPAPSWMQPKAKAAVPPAAPVPKLGELEELQRQIREVEEGRSRVTAESIPWALAQLRAREQDILARPLQAQIIGTMQAPWKALMQPVAQPDVEAAAAQKKAQEAAQKIAVGLAPEMLIQPHERAIDALNEQLDRLQESSQGAGDATRGLRREQREMQAAMRESAEEVQRLEGHLADLRRTLDNLARPRLIGAGAFEEQVFALEQRIREARLREMEFGPVGAEDKQRRAELERLTAERRELDRQLDILQLQREIFTAPIEFKAEREALGVKPEWTPEALFAEIPKVQQAIVQAQADLVVARATYDANQAAVNAMTREIEAAEDANRDAAAAQVDQEKAIRNAITAENDKIIRIKEVQDALKALADFQTQEMIPQLIEGLSKYGVDLKEATQRVTDWLAELIRTVQPEQVGWKTPEAELTEMWNPVPSRQAGGFVPGAEGNPQLILAHAGELVLNRAQQRAAAGAGVTVTNNFNSAFPPRKEDADSIAAVIEERLQDRNARTPGGLWP